MVLYNFCQREWKAMEASEMKILIYPPNGACRVMDAIKIKIISVSGPEYYSKYFIEPVDFIYANNLDFLTGNVIKYLLRWREKDGIEDLEKAKVYLEMLMEGAK